MSRANLPMHSSLWLNDGDLNASAPDGEVVPPGGTHAMSGMSIREAFAMAALEGIIASNRAGSSIVLDVASQAREYADALLDELAQEPRS